MIFSPGQRQHRKNAAALKNLNLNIKVQIYRNRLKMAVSFIL